MINQLLITALFVAGIAVCWRNLQTDLPSLKKFLSKFPYVFRKSLTCGFCFTFWAALVTTILANPLAGISEKYNLVLPVAVFPTTDLFVGWVALGMLSVIIRFGYVVLQELVHYQVHILRDSNHKH